MQNTRKTLERVPEDKWGWKPHDLLAIAAYRLGLFELAVKQGNIALSFAPDDERLNQNMNWYLKEASPLSMEGFVAMPMKEGDKPWFVPLAAE